MIVDTEDLRGRSCPMCGAVMADEARHLAWHRRQTVSLAVVLDAIAGTEPDDAALVELEAERSRRKHPSNGGP